MGYWFYEVNLPYQSPSKALLFSFGDGGDRLTPPPDAVSTARLGRSCGSGPYYKTVMHPYLRDDYYEARGSHYCGAPKLYDRVPDWRGFRARCCSLTNLQICQATGVRNTGNNSCGQGGFDIVQMYDFTPQEHTPYCMIVTLSIMWTQTDGMYPESHEGCFGCDCESFESLCSAAQFCLEAVGYDGGHLFDPLSIDNHIWYSGQERRSATIDPIARAGVSVNITASWWLSYQSWNFSGVDDITIRWRYDSPPNRMTEWLSVADCGIIPGRIRNATSNALADAMAGLPEVSANSVANVMELASGLPSIVNAGAKGISGILQKLRRGVKDLSDPRNAWLSWRYVYNTTKMDIQDYKDVTNRLTNLSGNPTFKVHGSGSGDGFSIRTVRQYRSADFNIIDYDTKRLLRTYGFQLDAYNMWDMVPFSFMVDWFTHVGPKLELARNWNRQYDFTATDVWYSYHEQLDHGYVYYRWHGVDPAVPPSYVQHATSKRTITYRLADTVSIFT